MKKVSSNLNKDHQIPENEVHLYHVELVKRENDPIKKKYVDHKQVQKFTPAEFKLMKDIKFFATYDEVNIFHNPLNIVGPVMPDGEELKALIEKYTELFGKAPANNAKPENIAAKIEFAELGIEFQIKFGLELPATVKTADEIRELLKSDTYF